MTDPRQPIQIKPRNLTARASAQIVGNPSNTRLDGSVGNCFPGLEMDVRDLDRRFFPGLVFNAVRVPLFPVAEAPKNTQGFHLVFVDYFYDPMLPGDSPEDWVQTLLSAYSGDIGTRLSKGRWFLDWVEQDGKTFHFSETGKPPMDGLYVWRFIRSIQPGKDRPLRIALQERNHDGEPVGDPVIFDGYRRTYRTEDGVFDASYTPGELTQSLCNPWSHDFRDCGCHYWPSNHPDVVHAAVPADELMPGGHSSDPLAAATLVDWLRNDKGPAGDVAALNTVEQNRPFQIDHYQVNQMWSDLPIVVENRETGEVYHADPDVVLSAPYQNTKAMTDELGGYLAPLELVLTLQYLYAYFSLADPESVDQESWPSLKDDLIFARRAILEVAIGEMTHLRWANQLLWELIGPDYEPVLTPAMKLRMGPGKGDFRVRALKPLTLDVLDEFIKIERPGGAIDNAYQRCVKTLEQRDLYEKHLYSIAIRIDTDGEEHFLRFERMRQILAKYDTGDGSLPAYLRPLKLATKDQAADALAAYHALLEGLRAAYVAEAKKDYPEAEKNISAMRELMERLRVEGEKLAAQNLGIPFWEEVTV